jgi:folate/biopterin transporter
MDGFVNNNSVSVNRWSLQIRRWYCTYSFICCFCVHGLPITVSAWNGNGIQYKLYSNQFRDRVSPYPYYQPQTKLGQARPFNHRKLFRKDDLDGSISTPVMKDEDKESPLFDDKMETSQMPFPTTISKSQSQSQLHDPYEKVTMKNEDIDKINFSTLQSKIMGGIELTPEILAIMLIYFVEGALGLARLAQTFLLKDELHLGPAEMSALTGLFTLPWTIKPLYGFLSDGLPIFGYRRRSYLVLCGILGCLSYLSLGFPTIHFTLGDMVTNDYNNQQDVTWITIELLLGSACIACCDVVADGIVVQLTRDSRDPKVAGGLQSLCWGSAAVGGLLSAYFSGSLLTTMTPRQVFGITAILPFLVTLISFQIQESTSENTNVEANGPEQIQNLISAIRQPSIWKPALFLFLWQSTPTSDGAFLYFMTEDLGMGPEFLGRVRLVTALASLVGVWVYQTYLRNISIKKILLWSSLISTPLGLTSLLLISHVNRDLGIPDGAFVFGDDVALAILGQVAFLPTLVLAAQLCPKGVEAVLFATLMSLFNGASTIGTEIGALLTKYMGVTETNFENLGLLTIVCNLSSLYPLVFLGLLDGIGDFSEEDVESRQVL